MRIITKLLSIYRHVFWSFERQARYAGVEMGTNNFIGSAFWSDYSRHPYTYTWGG